MKLPKTFFQGLSKERYEQYLKLLPELKQEKKHAYINLVLTFAAMAIFGFFAISPTLTTIAQLKKQLSDSQYAETQLETKIKNLSTLQQKYTELTPVLPVIKDAIPDNPATAPLLGQLQAIAKESDITLHSLQSFQVQLAGPQSALLPQTPELGPAQQKSYVVSLEGEGTYNSIANMIQTVGQFNRIVTIESLGVTKSTKDPGMLLMNLRLRAYFGD